MAERINRNKVYKKKDFKGDGKKLMIHEIFHSIQMEGVFTGRPATFIRLYGCNLNCSFCDTRQSKSEEMSVKAIVKEANQEPHTKLAVITGGEPFLHNLVPLTKALLKKGFIVQFETNGTLTNKDMPWGPRVVTVVSPKTKDIHPDIIKNAFAYKYVVKVGMQDDDGLPKGLWKPDLTSKVERKKIMISPMFENWSEETKANTAEAVKICLHFGYYLSIQIHKLIQGVK